MSRRGPRRGRAIVSSAPTAPDFVRSRLRQLGIALVCAKVALVPVIFDYGSDVPFSVSKALLSHALAYVLAGVMVGLIAQYGRTVLVWSRLHIPVLVFLVVNIAATVFAVDHLLALYGAHTRMVGLGTIADCVLLYFAIALLVRTGRDTLALALSFFGGAVVVLAYEFIQLLGKDPLTWAIDPATRPFSTIGQTTSLAEYLSVVAVGAAAAAIFMRGLPAAARAVLILFSGVAIAGTVVTQTRSAVLGLIAAAGLLVALTWAAHPHPRARLISTIGAAGAGVALAVVLFMTPLGARLLSTVETAATAEGESGSRLEESADARVALYRIAFEMLRDRPALGHGPDTFLASLPRFRSDAEPYGVQDNPSNSAHSWVAQVGATSGLGGLIAFVAIAAIGIVLTFRRGFLPEAWAALAMLVAFLGAGLTTVNAIATDWLFWAAAGAIASSTSHPAPTRVSELAEPPNTRRTKSTKTYPISRTRSTIAYVCVGVGFVLALTTMSALDASRSVKASQLARLQGQTQRAIDLGLQATRSDPLRPQYWNTLGLAYVSANRLAEAVSSFDRASSLAPYDVRYDGDLARAYAAQFLQGDKTANSRARGVADRVVRTDPNNPRAQHTRAVVMQATGDLPEAVKSSERAVALDRTTDAGYTSNPEIFVLGVQVLNAVGRPLDAITLARRAMPILGDEVVRVPLRIELSRALLANGQAAEALTEIDAALSMRPSDQNAQQLRAQIQAALR